MFYQLIKPVEDGKSEGQQQGKKFFFQSFRKQLVAFVENQNRDQDIKGQVKERIFLFGVHLKGPLMMILKRVEGACQG